MEIFILIFNFALCTFNLNETNVCLAIPKKVVEINGDILTVELPNGTRQEVKSIVELTIGDFCLTQQNMAIEKMDKEDAEELINQIFTIRKEGINI